MKTIVKPRITLAESLARQEAVDFARGSVRFEGVVLSAAVEEINRRYVAGEFDTQEHVDRIKAAALDGAS